MGCHPNRDADNQRQPLEKHAIIKIPTRESAVTVHFLARDLTLGRNFSSFASTDEPLLLKGQVSIQGRTLLSRNYFGIDNIELSMGDAFRVSSESKASKNESLEYFGFVATEPGTKALNAVVRVVAQEAEIIRPFFAFTFYEYFGDSPNETSYLSSALRDLIQAGTRAGLEGGSIVLDNALVRSHPGLKEIFGDLAREFGAEDYVDGRWDTMVASMERQRYRPPPEEQERVRNYEKRAQDAVSGSLMRQCVLVQKVNMLQSWAEQWCGCAVPIMQRYIGDEDRAEFDKGFKIGREALQHKYANLKREVAHCAI